MRTHRRIAVVDTGPLVAAANRGDVHHQRCVAALRTPGLGLVIPTLVVTEACYFIGQRVGAAAEAAFLRALAALDIEAPHFDDWPRLADLVERYGDLPLGAVDASVVVLAERRDTDVIISLDRRHFTAVRPRHCPAFRLLPE